MLIEIIIILVAIVVLAVVGRLVRRNISEKHTIERLINILFPLGESQMNETLNDIDEMTQKRFKREEILDYYLKIKGLQIIDLHANSDGGIRRFLMKPTKIRLTYFEQVKFYEIYLNYPQAVGQSLVER
ncbi:MAG: hypothetical protein MJZ01_06695 [Bacteroidales bacterium]|nr:hypothetical protein [Bacteroidales bacterium]